MQRLIFTAVGAAALVLCACEKPRTPTPADLALVTRAVDAQLNEPAEQLQRNLKQANTDKRIYVEELTVNLDSGVYPVDWWIYDHGLIKLKGVDSYYRGYFNLTPAGEAFVRGGAPRWLVSQFKSPPQVSCSSGGSFTTCQVSGVASVRQVDAAKGLFHFAGLPDQAIQGELDYGAQGWQAGEVKLQGGPVADAARKQMFGDWPQIYKARARFAEAIQRQLK